MTNLNYQGIGPRIAAQIVDTIIILILYMLVGFAMAGSFSFDFTGEAAYPIIAASGLIVLLYFVLLEGLTGATIGKRLLKIKVVRVDGSPCGIGPAAIRTILRIIDGLPFLYIIGMILIARSPMKQRLGDRVARTVVIKVGETPVSSMPPAPAPSGTFCISCGAAMPSGVKFCPKCGAKRPGS